LKKSIHTIYITSMVLITVLVTLYLIYTGYDYYQTPYEERFYHPHHDWFKPSGAFGHGLGIAGTLMILFGVVIYIARKRYNFMAKTFRRLKYLLEFHIFMCTLGPILILFHTAFKFGGIVSVAFWSMVAVVLSGVVGRFIYIQIPRSIEGRALTLSEIKDLQHDWVSVLHEEFQFDDQLIHAIMGYTEGEGRNGNKKSTRQLARMLKQRQVPKKGRVYILRMVKQERALARKIARLESMQNLFKYWHVAHLPFALVMLVIVVLHVAITLAFGYKWIF